MKKFLIIFGLILLLIVTGCGSSKEKDIKTTDFKSMIGEYKIDSVELKNKSYDEKLLEKEKLSMSLRVNDDKTMILYYNKKQYKFTYDSKYLVAKNKKKSIKSKYTFKDDVLTIDVKSIGKMVFKKDNNKNVKR